MTKSILSDIIRTDIIDFILEDRMIYGMFAFFSAVNAILLYLKPNPELPSPWVYLTIFCFCMLMYALDSYRVKNNWKSSMYGPMAFLCGLATIVLFNSQNPDSPSPWSYFLVFCFAIIMFFLDHYRTEKRLDSLLNGAAFWGCLFAMGLEANQGQYGFTYWLFGFGAVVNAISWIITVVKQMVIKKHQVTSTLNATQDVFRA